MVLQAMVLPRRINRRRSGTLAWAKAFALCIIVTISLTSVLWTWRLQETDHFEYHRPAFNITPPVRMHGPLFQPPLRTNERYIVDATGHRFKLLSVNWYGGSDELFVPGGLDVRPREDIARLIRSLGFNSVRLPYSDEMVITNPIVAPVLLEANPDLVGMSALEVFTAVVEACTDAGLAVIINDHITEAGWC